MSSIMSLERRVARAIASDISPELSESQEEALRQWLKKYYDVSELKYPQKQETWTALRQIDDSLLMPTRITCHALIEHCGRSDSWDSVVLADERLEAAITQKMEKLCNLIHVIRNHEELARIIISEDKDDQREVNQDVGDRQ